ncbi:MAG: methionine ABC transporter ATP-binding protein [Bacillota bacterium]|nr:methionine ABC transporter ATP-binding protein [Bacillota bacterium]
MIDIQHVSKIYKTPTHEVKALDDVSLSIKSGEIFGIIGLSGAGKSTLIRCINRLEKPTCGSIVVDGQDITQLNKQELRSSRQRIGMIFQQFNLLSSRTVFENVMFPLEISKTPKAKSKKKVLDLLALVGLSDKADVYPNQLSGGQKQRVGIARALANDPKILLCDEATSALDPQTTRSILKLLKDINRQLNLTILLITHDMGVIKEICDRVAVISNSQIVEVGDVLTLFSNPQTPTSKSFINTVFPKEFPVELVHSSGLENAQKANRLIRISFIGKSAGEPIISTLIRRFDVDANILYGNVDRINETPFGNLTLELMGNPNQINEAMHYLQKNGLEIEVLHHDK